MSDRRPLGMFDSGVGGLTVFEQVARYLPQESVVYFGDTLNVPYGGRSVRELLAFGDRIIRFFCKKNVKYIIFACNTSSSVSLGFLRERYSVPMLGLVEPAAQEALAATRNKRIGLLATEATVRSNSYAQTLTRLDPEVKVFSQPAPRLVPLVETSRVKSSEAAEAVATYIAPLKEAGIDTLILGCTHYPFFIPMISRLLGPEVRLTDPAVAIAIKAKEELQTEAIEVEPLEESISETTLIV